MAEPIEMDFADLPYQLRAGAPKPPEPDKVVSWGDSWEASWTTESTGQAIYNLSTNEEMPEATEDEINAYYMQQFNPHEYVKENHPDLADDSLFEYFDERKSSSQVEYTVKMLRREIAARRTQADAPWYQQLATDVGAAAVGSPATYAEIGLMASPWGRAGKLGLTAARGGRRALQAGGLVAATTGVEEYILHQDQMLRTGIESAVAFGGSLFLGSGFGYLTGAREIRLNPDLSTSVPNSGGAMGAPGGGAGGAADVLQDISRTDYDAIMADPELTSAQKLLKVMDKQAENYQIVSGLGVGRAVVALGKKLQINPETRHALSDSPVMQRLAAFMENSPYLRVGQKEGSVDLVNIDSVAMRGDTRIEVGVNDIFTRNYKAYKKSGQADPNIQSELDFARQVQIAGSRGDMHDNPFVQKASQDLRAEFTGPMGQRGVRHNLLKGDDDGNPVAPLGDKSWFLRSFSRNYAGRVTREQYAEGLVGPYMKRLRQAAADEKAEIEGQVAKLKDKQKQLKAVETADKESVRRTQEKLKKDIKALRRKNPYGRELKRLEKDDSVLRKRFMKMRDEVMNGSANADAHEFSGLGLKMEADGSFKMSSGRTLDVATEDLPIDYLDPDPKLSIINALKRTNRQLLMYEDPRFGDPTLANWRKLREDEHNARLELAAGDVKQTRKLLRQYERDMKDISNLMKSYYQIRPDNPAAATMTFFSNLKAFNALTGLGSVLFSTIPELGAALSHQGVRGYVRHVTGWVTNPALMRDLTRVQKAELDIGIQSSLGMRLMEVGEYSGDMGKASRMLHRAADVAVDKVYMLGTWTRTMSSQVGVMTQSKLARLAVKKKLSKQDISDLGRMGISQDMLPAVRAQVEAHGKKLPGGAWDAGLDKWDNAGVKQHIINGINQEVDNIIIRPGTGATPFIGRSLAGSVIMQFKQFLLAATSKYLLADIQRAFAGDLRAIERQLAIAALGYASVYMKSNWLYGEQSRKRWEGMSDSERIVEGVINGGGGGLAFDFINLNREAMYPGASQRYYGQRNVESMIAGPSWGRVNDVVNAAGLIGAITSEDHDVQRAHIKSIVRSVPGNSFWPVRAGWPTLKEDLYEVARDIED